MKNYIALTIVGMVGLFSCNNNHKNDKEENKTGGPCDYRYETKSYLITKKFPHQSVFNLALENVKQKYDTTNYMSLAMFGASGMMIDSAKNATISIGDTLHVTYASIISGSCTPNHTSVEFSKKK